MRKPMIIESKRVEPPQQIDILKNNITIIIDNPQEGHRDTTL